MFGNSCRSVLPDDVSQRVQQHKHFTPSEANALKSKLKKGICISRENFDSGIFLLG